jgi:SAM-dependent methyltransferase
MHTNADNFIEPSKLGSWLPPYRPTHDYPGEFINETHAAYATCPQKGLQIDLGIHGWLCRQDALKLYEMAFFATGDVLELGTLHGLSTSILSRALIDAGRGGRLVTVELDPYSLALARQNLASRGLDQVVDFVQANAVDYCRQAARTGRRFSFAFVDHSHAYQAVLPVCEELPKLIAPGGFCYFHDYNDQRNLDAGNADYGVSQAVDEGLDARRFAFHGIFGCAILYHATQHPAEHSGS